MPTKKPLYLLGTAAFCLCQRARTRLQMTRQAALYRHSDNQIMKELNAEKRLQEYIVSLNGSVPEDDLLQFAKDSAEQFTPILL